MENKEILLAANKAVTKGDHEGFLKFCAEDTQWNFIGDQKLEGKEAVRHWMVENYENPPQFNVENLIAEDDFVTVTGSLSMTNADVTTHYEYCDVWRFHNGKMAELWAYVVEISKT